ncbi:hypothetical protein SAMN05428949_7359 [Chitinophaga sp. YR627]|uniref:hypothetical protein n=1 Tax=Chitinophaga sp. YR627 TaxID=1881041 RepID=UPI0008E77C1D|nr:hypothetical protein [Chitinophaga sp. YR627]SFP09940.1 hypothetical protein SAMN05428949_7359 [Chitinophaga sp. YR627]
MKAFTVVYNTDRYMVKPLNGHSPRFRVNVNGQEVIFEHDMDGHIRAEANKVASMSLLLAIADKIEENTGM